MATEETRVPIIIGIASTLISLTFCIVSLRAYTRTVILRQFGTDDVWALISFLLLFSCGLCILLGIKYGFGTHKASLSDDQFRNYRRVFYVSIIFYNATLGAIKMTLLSQYHRAFAVRSTRKVIVIAMFPIAAWSISQIILCIFVCTPISAFWDTEVGGKCVPNLPQWYINAAGNIATDLFILLIPLPALAKLNLAPRQRYILIAIFCLGFFTCVISSARIWFLDQLEDLTWVNAETASWSLGELSCGLLCACLPTIRPLISRLFPKLLSRIQTSRSHNTWQRHENVGSSHQYRDIELQGLPPGDSEASESGGRLEGNLNGSVCTVTKMGAVVSPRSIIGEDDIETLLASQPSAQPQLLERARARSPR